MFNHLYLKFTNFMKDEEGLGTLEIILIVVVLVGIAILFRDAITGWVNDLIQNIGDNLFDVDSVE